MSKFKQSLYGFIIFFFTVGFNFTVAIIVYDQIKDKDLFIIAFVLLSMVIMSALLFTLIDYLRRKNIIDHSLKEILEATEKMSNGDFNIKLVHKNKYKYYDEFDYIKEHLNKLASELSKSEVLKNDFVSNVSHEIKTPLSIIQNYAKALENNDLNDEQRKKYLSVLQSTCKKLSDLVSNILKLNKLENQKLNPIYSNVNISELLINQILQFESLIDNKNINLECDIEESINFNCVESFMEIVFNNLISNAIKFTNNDGNIKIKLIKFNKEYIISFEDDGCGMDKETGMHIFDKFYQGDTSHSSEGNGLGLALVKKVIDILGGTITVESEIGKGTKFTIIMKEKDDAR